MMSAEEKADAAAAKECGGIHRAASDGNLPALRHFVRSDPGSVHKGDTYGWTPLHLAALYGHIDCAEFLLSNGAKVNATRSDGATPLHLAAGNDQVACAEFLLSNGAKVNATRSDGRSPLKLARARGLSKMVEFLQNWCEAKKADDSKTPPDLAKGKAEIKPSDAGKTSESGKKASEAQQPPVSGSSSSPRESSKEEHAAGSGALAVKHQRESSKEAAKELEEAMASSDVQVLKKAIDNAKLHKVSQEDVMKALEKYIALQEAVHQSATSPVGKAAKELEEAMASSDVQVLKKAIDNAKLHKVSQEDVMKALEKCIALQEAVFAKAKIEDPISPTSPAAKLPTDVPEYWSQELSLEQGWAAFPVEEDTLAVLKELFAVRQPEELGKGRDAGSYHRKYSQLEIHCAWRIEHENDYLKYCFERNNVLRQMRQLEKQKVKLEPWTSAMEEASRKMPGQLYSEVGERYLLHGTSPKHLLDILQQGFSEKLASLKGMFGAGNYFAEAPEKIDQYTRPDEGWETPGLEDLHSRLYRAGGNIHPGKDVFYCFLVRVTCGACLQTKGLDEERLRDNVTGQEVFLNKDRRELSRVPGAVPTFSYHTLVVNLGAAGVAGAAVLRFREFISFSGIRIYPEYLIAYCRV